MNKILLNFIFIAFLCLVFINCANRGTPGGGPKDETPPNIEKSIPENFSTNFKGNEITIVFNEYIKIKNIQKQLIISPPMKWQPDITPLGNASKEIKIKINDTLAPNTTYAFNFGNSITDNNEGNSFPFYRYVLSTGDYIDSLTVKGQIIDALKPQPETFVTVGLYEIDSTFNDSIVYKQPPKYITNTLDSVTTFSIENIKAGKYMLMALKDNNDDNKFQQKTDQIAFLKSFIDVPTDSLYTLKLFSETPDFKASKPFLMSDQKIAFGYQGNYKNMNIKVTSETPKGFTHRISKDKKTDTLYYWYKPKLEVDSLLFKVSHTTFEKEYTVRIRDLERDSLIINTEPNGIIGKKEPFKIFANIPFISFDTSKMSILDKDSTSIDFKTEYDSLANTYAVNFEKTEDNIYRIQMLPEAFNSFFDHKNDTLNFAVKTKKESDYGYIRFNLVNAIYPLIFQLTDKDGNVKYEQYSKTPGSIDFLNIDSGKYLIRVIFDTNGNKEYDSGNFLKKIEPERVSHFKLSEDVRSDWSFVQTLNFTE